MPRLRPRAFHAAGQEARRFVIQRILRQGSSMAKHLFIVGLDPFNRAKLERLPQAADCQFHTALDIADIRHVAEYDIDALIEQAITRIESAGVPVDGVASYYDFPGTVLAAVLAEHFGTPHASLESIIKCEHKYWSRLEQQKVIPHHIPPFRAFDPFDPDAFQKLDLLPPYWIKPIKSFRSFLAYRINDERQFNEVMQVCQARAGFLVDPFRRLMDRFDMPDELAHMPETFIAEGLIGGAQCTLEGYVVDGSVSVYGVVDSVRESDSSSFSRYEYPSRLPLEIQHRMIDVARAAIRAIGLDNSPFNVEFFYDQTADNVWLLEINPRISQAHSDIFEKVHGHSHHAILVDLALGRKPAPMERHGRFNVAAHFMLRTFERGRISRIPSQQALERIQERLPGTVVKIPVQVGQHLDDLQGQDSYSYELANVFIGGRDQADLLDQYDQVLMALQFEVDKDTETIVH